MFKQYIHKRVKRIRRNWKQYLVANGHESLHQMRVEIKKLLAVLHFLKDSAPEFKLKRCTRFIRHTFAISGEIRDSSNALLLAKKFHLDIPATSETGKGIKKLKKRYQRSRTRLGNLERQTAKHLNILNVKLLREYVHQQLIEITGQIGEGLKKDNLHGLRKKLKDIYYLDKLLQEKDKGLPGATGKHINTLQDLIGKWHDLEKFKTGILVSKKQPAKAVQLMKVEEKRLLAHIYKLSGTFVHPKGV